MVSKRASLYGENGKLLHQGAFDMEKKREKMRTNLISKASMQDRYAEESCLHA